jgi:iron uptake system component EfeO
VRPAALRKSRGTWLGPPRAAAATVASAAVALAVAGGAVAGGGGTPASSGVISVSNGGCGVGWHLAGPGWHTFQVYNASAVGGHARGIPAILPVTRNDLLAPARTDHHWIAAGLGTLAGQTAALAADIRGGNLGQAKAGWLTAHLTYERLGAAYDAFGDFDGKINGTAAGLDGGVSAPACTGF